MKRIPVFILSLFLLACGQSQSQTKDRNPAQVPKLQPGEAVATFAGGCF
ncbi:MAG: peptide-methionine (S)-S-oxide reductase, partial [Sphingobacteriaceae bacterium]|nr:peptide-methionine (S)-S-oxide reductase [Cytophagaceae bacterium]